MRPRPPIPSPLLALVVCGVLLAAPRAEARKLTIKIGTVAPQGTVYHKALLEVANAFEEETDGKVQAKVYAGVVGDEPTIVRKMRIGQLQAAALTNTGMALITTEPMAVQLPMQFKDELELDEVLEKMTPIFNKALEEDGFVSLMWTDAGWVHFFTKKPASSLEDINGMKMWMWAHDEAALESFAALGFSPVVLSGVDIIPSLQTGMIEALPTTTISALAIQSYPLTPNMIDIRWGAMLGGVVIAKKTWDRIPAEAQPKIRQRCAEIGKRLSEAVRRDSASALEAMKQKGLQVHTPDAKQMEAWQERAKKARALVRGRSVDAALADKAMALRDAFRKQRGK